MSMTVKQVRAWLSTINEDSLVYVDDDGICLRSEEEPDAYLELGGHSDDEYELEEQGGVIDLSKPPSAQASIDNGLIAQGLEPEGDDDEPCDD